MDESVRRGIPEKRNPEKESTGKKNPEEKSPEEDFCGDRSFLKEAEETFGLTLPDVRSYSGLSLAFIGDGVYELAVRTLIISRGNTQVNRMHRQCSELVKAPTQAAMIRAVFNQLTEEEQSVCRRGHNTKPHTKAKNATADDYLWATGLEALCGWLYLKHDQHRMMEIIRTGLSAVGYEL